MENALVAEYGLSRQDLPD